MISDHSACLGHDVPTKNKIDSFTTKMASLKCFKKWVHDGQAQMEYKAIMMVK